MLGHFFTIIFREQLVVKCNIIHEKKDLSSAYYINYNKAISLRYITVHFFTLI